jgi:hypothetical protein
MELRKPGASSRSAPTEPAAAPQNGGADARKVGAADSDRRSRLETTTREDVAIPARRRIAIQRSPRYFTVQVSPE